MANFKTHISWGALLAIATIVAGLLLSIIKADEVLSWIFFAVLAGSFLPDLDLDEGVPFQILFGLAAAGFAGSVFFNFYRAGSHDLKTLVVLPVLAFAVIRFAVGYVFMKFTHHRGMFHSIPAAILAGLLAIWILDFFAVKESVRIFAGVGISIGYLGHLILDEIYSTVNFDGLFFRPRKSLGSALKLFSRSKIATIMVYALILILFSKLG